MSLCPVSCVCGAAKLEDASFDHIPSASRPSSPDTQLAATSPGQGAELSREEAATYSRWGRGLWLVSHCDHCTRYITEELKDENIETMGKDLLDRIK